MHFLRLRLAYDGTDFAGWQVQPQQRTVQDLMQRAWQQVSGESVGIIASGRTDSGVHALGQVCSVCTESNLSCQAWAGALNAHLPADIRVLQVDRAPQNFHAVRDAIRKTYRYVIQLDRIPNLFWRHYAWHVRGPLQIEPMIAAAQRLCGRRDFASFQSTGSERLTTVRDVQRLELRESLVDGFSRLEIEITADGFLYNMVRNIVGTLVLIGQGKQPAAWVEQVLAAQDRTAAGPTAPGQGLFLLRVDYDF